MNPNLPRLMRPASVAVIGASDNSARIGGRPIRYLLDAGFAGPIYPVNPNYQIVQGLPAYASLLDVPGPVDMAIIALPAIPAMQAIRDCATRQVGGAVLFSADFAEAGGDGQARQAELSRIVQEAGIALLGPNCLGAFNVSHRFYASFSAIFEGGFPAGGDAGIISQSGGFGSHLAKIALQRGVKIGQWITTGNEAGIDVGQGIEWLAGQPDIRIIMAYAEGVHARDTLVAGLEAARQAGKPVLFMKSGSSSVGAAAAQTHTAAMSGSDLVFSGMLEQYGAVRIPHTEAMVDAAYLLQRAPRPAGNRVGLVSISGAVGVQMADTAAQVGLEVPALPSDAQAALKAINPYAATRNPIDVTAQAFNNLDLVRDNLDVVLRQDGLDALIAFFTVTAGSRSIAPRLSQILSPLPQQYPDKPMLLCIVADQATVAQYEAAGFAVFEDQHRAVSALGVLARLRPAPAPPLAMADFSAAAKALRRHDGTEYSGKQVLAALGIPVPAGGVATDSGRAVGIALEVGLPVAVKIHSATILHKSDIGGVMLNLATPDAVATAASAMLDRLGDAVLVEKMAPPAVEVILGFQHDAELGPITMIGLGGVQAEIYQDVVCRLAPVSAAEAQRALHSLRGRRMFEGFRGLPAADLPALAAMIERLSQFFAAHADEIESLEINPVRVLAPGQGAIACDAVLLKR